MSMTTLVILRFLGIFAVYTGVTLALPALMFRRILRGRSLAEQFLMCYTFGNFYIINIVFLLQLLHISNFFTLAGLTAVLSIVIGGRVNRIPLKQQAGNTWHLFGKLLRGRMKLKSAIFLFLGKCAAGIKRLAKFFYRHIVKNPIQSMLLLGIGVCLCWIYGRQIILVYGYRASDIPVHMSWINEMSREEKKKDIRFTFVIQVDEINDYLQETFYESGGIFMDKHRSRLPVLYVRKHDILKVKWADDNSRYMNINKEMRKELKKIYDDSEIESINS